MMISQSREKDKLVNDNHVLLIHQEDTVRSMLLGSERASAILLELSANS